MNNYRFPLKKPAELEITRDERFLDGQIDVFDLLAITSEKERRESSVLIAKRP
jgi:hypothetical protein